MNQKTITRERLEGIFRSMRHANAGRDYIHFQNFNVHLGEFGRHVVTVDINEVHPNNSIETQAFKNDLYQFIALMNQRFIEHSDIPCVSVLYGRTMNPGDIEGDKLVQKLGRVLVEDSVEYKNFMELISLMSFTEELNGVPRETIKLTYPVSIANDRLLFCVLFAAIYLLNQVFLVKYPYHSDIVFQNHSVVVMALVYNLRISGISLEDTSISYNPEGSLFQYVDNMSNQRFMRLTKIIDTIHLNMSSQLYRYQDLVYYSTNEDNKLHTTERYIGDHPYLAMVAGLLMQLGFIQKPVPLKIPDYETV